MFRLKAVSTLFEALQDTPIALKGLVAQSTRR